MSLGGCDYSSSRGGGNTPSSVASNAPRLSTATLVDIDGGGPSEGDVVLLRFDRPVVLNSSSDGDTITTIRPDLPTDTFGADAREGQSVPGSGLLELVLGEDPELLAGDPGDAGITKINVVNGSGRVVPVEGTNGVRAAPARRSVELEDVTGVAPVAIAASYFDADNDGAVGVGDILLVTFDQPVVVPDGATPGGAFATPVAGDSFGAGATLEPASESAVNRGVRVLFGDDPVLTVAGSFSSAATSAGAASGVRVAVNSVLIDAVLSSGASVEAGVELDVAVGDANLFGNGRDAAFVVGGIDPFTPALTAQGVEKPAGLDAFAGTLSFGDTEIDASLVFVADRENDRVLIFENVASGSFAAASWVLGQETLVSESQPDPTRRGAVPPTASTLRAPADVAFDPATNRLFVSDTENHRILVWTELFFADAGRLALENGRAADFALGQPTVVEGRANRGQSTPSALSLSSPSGLSIDAGRLAVADTGNHRVLVFSTLPEEGSVLPSAVLGQIVFDAGAANAGATSPDATTLSAPRDVLLSSDFTLPVGAGALFVADTGNHRVVVYAETVLVSGGAASFAIGQPDKMSSTGALSASGLDTPLGVSADVLNSAVYVADSGNHRVMVYDGTALSDGVAGQAIGQVDASGGSPNRGGAAGAETLRMPAAVQVLDDVLVVSDSGNHRILFYGDGALPTAHEDAFQVFGQGDFASVAPGGRQFSRPGDVLLVGGRVVLSDTANHRVLIFDAVPLSNADRPDVVLGQADARSFNANRGGPPDASTLKWPTGLATDGTGLAVADSGNHRVLIWSRLPAGDGAPADIILGQETGTAQLPNAGSGVSAETFHTPVGLAVSEGLFVVADGGNHRVLLFDDFSGLGDFAPADLVVGQSDFESREANRGEGLSRFGLHEPRGVLVAGNRLYVADSANHRVLVWRPVPQGNGRGADRIFGQGGFDTAVQATPSSGSLLYPTGLASDVNAMVLYVADTGRHRVVVYDDVRGGPPFVAARHVLGQPNLVTGHGQDLEGPSFATLHCPQGIFFNGYELLVSDQGNSRLAIFR